MLGMKHLKFVSERESDQYKQQINNNLFSIPTMLLLLRLYLLTGNHQRIAIENCLTSTSDCIQHFQV